MITTTKPMEVKMDAKEKAKELVTKMYVNQWRNNTMEYKTAKQCALIAVEEILNNFGQLTDGANFYTSYDAIK